MTGIEVAGLLSQMVTLLNASAAFFENSSRYREMVATAVAEGRDLHPDELRELRIAAHKAVEKL